MARLLGVLLVLAFIAGVAIHVWPPAAPLGYAGLQFADITRAAAARAPLMTTRGAIIQDVAEDSPAALAGLAQGEVVEAIDGVKLRSARQASDLIKTKRAGQQITLSVLDESSGEIRPKQVRLTFAAAPPVPRKKFTVKPQRILAREFFFPPGMAANAAWSKKLLRGPTIRPLALKGLGAGQCNGLAPEEWVVRGHGADDQMLHLAAKAGFMHAIYQSRPFRGGDPKQVLLAALGQEFDAPAVATPTQSQAFGFSLFHYGLSRGATGFVLYRVSGGRLTAWIAAVPAADAAWAEPLAGAVALSIHCPAPAPAGKRPAGLAATSVSLACIQGHCSQADLAGSYMSQLHLAFVHGSDGDNYLVNPKRDFWQNGAEGPGFYHQIGGANEKLEPGRTN